ncbi:MAG: ABC transporter permease [Erysipelotrichaceae bacterium]|nr:ABC transporter permease [Erysipelotrichaceae bacterium]
MKLLISMFPTVLLVATPIIIAALGGLFSERSGIVNIALEGIMMVGGFAGATVCVLLESQPGIGAYAGWMGILAGLIAGVVYSLLLAVSTISFKADHTIAGTALNMLASGITVYLCQIIFGQQRTKSFIVGISKVKRIPILSNIPIIGKMIFSNVYPTIFIAVILVLFTYFLVFKTRFGLRLRACGENPQAAESVGINVYKVRYISVLISGALAGSAGAIMVLTSGIQYTISSIHGVGFIAIAALIFGKWNPFGVLGAGIFFGFSSALGVYASMIPILKLLPSEFFAAIPYVLTVVALIIFSGKSVGPKAAGEIFDSSKR